MKNKLAAILLPSFILIVLFSCTKKENKIYYEGGTAPALTASKTGTITLSFATKDQEAVKLSWTNPNYMFTTGVSSQNVSYQLEIDTTSANFTNPKKKTLSLGNSLSLSLTQAEFNDYLLNGLELVPAISHNIEIRVKSFLVNNSALLTSNVLKFTVTPYAIPPKVTPPTNSTLWITGSAVESNWANPIPSAPTNYEQQQKFTKVSDTKYELVVKLISGGGYKLIQTQGDWSTQYSFVAGSGDALGGEFEKRDAAQFNAPAATAVYKLTFDFQTGKFTIVKQ